MYHLPLVCVTKVLSDIAWFSFKQEIEPISYKTADNAEPKETTSPPLFQTCILPSLYTSLSWLGRLSFVCEVELN